MSRYFQIIFVFLLLAISGCTTEKMSEDKDGTGGNVKIDLDQIKARGKLKVVTAYNSVDYFIYKGRPMGYQFELLQELSNYLGLKLDISVSNDVKQNFEDLKSGKVDLIAMNLTVTRDREKEFAFSEPHCYTRQVLIQRKNDRKGGKVHGFNKLIRNQLDLAGKSIYVQENSSYADRLRALSNEIGDSINVIEIPDYEVEQLIGLVAAGEIDYTVCDENLARVNKNYYNNIDVETPISFPQKIAWAMRKDAISLQDVVNRWMKSFKKTAKYRRIYQKYFLNKRSTHIVNEGFHSLKGGQFSVYDDIIKRESKKYDLDWRLVASIIYQESRFSPNIESWAGAVGLMQLMPETAKTFGVKKLDSPVDNIQGGLKFLKWLDEHLKKDVPDPEERIKFVLASYNVGLGHVQDAMRLAEKYGKDPAKWDGNVDFFLLNKSKPKYYNDPVVKFGYCRGEEPYYYVNDILERYEHYKNVVN
ncbi:MAG: transporter substrate-binding domain-containing protein [Chlorobi bacterium]|nr:transporter substrate-binding domain-containing protein [Chlorobiota bacterium]